MILNDSSVAKGGATGLAVLSARLLRERGLPATFIAGDAGDDGAIAGTGAELVALGDALLLDAGAAKAMKRGLYNTAARDKVAAYIAAHDTPGTVYHLHGWSRILSPAVFDALKPVAARTYIHAHDFFLACPNGAFFNFRQDQTCHLTPLSTACLTTACDRRGFHHKLWRSARSGMLRRTFDQATPWAGVLTLHPAMNAMIAKAGIPEGRISTVRNPARPLTPTRVPAENNNTFCFIGRVESGKGIRTLCEAAQIAGVPLKVIGDGAELAALKDAYPNVTFHGWVDQNQIGDLLRDVRALVMPSRTPEPFGLVAAEASLSGLPVILSEQSLLSADFAAQALGFACQTETAESIAAPIKAIAMMPADQIKALSEKAFTGKAGIAQSPDAWIDALLGHYGEATQHDAAA